MKSFGGQFKMKLYEEFSGTEGILSHLHLNGSNTQNFL